MAIVDAGTDKMVLKIEMTANTRVWKAHTFTYLNAGVMTMHALFLYIVRTCSMRSTADDIPWTFPTGHRLSLFNKTRHHNGHVSVSVAY